MIDASTKRTLIWLKRLDRYKLSRSIGKVTSTEPFTVKIGDVEHEGLPKLGSYTPTLDDRVYVARSGRSLTVLGVIEDT